jgi:L-fuconolactonase
MLDNVPVVDAHCHVSPVWYEPVETLLFQMDRNYVDAAILIQMLGQTDNIYQQECVSRYPGRFASVVIVDHTLPSAPKLLADLAEAGASGVRLRAPMRSPGDDPYAIWRTADQLGLAVSCAGTATDFASAEFADLLQALPTLKVVVEHMASTNKPDTTESDRQLRQTAFRTLSRHPNTLIKVHGVGEIAPRAMPPRVPLPFEEPIAPYFRQVYDAFGPERMMWGSDFPPVASREGYTNALFLCRDEFADRPAEARDLIFGGSAARTFPIR